MWPWNSFKALKRETKRNIFTLPVTQALSILGQMSSTDSQVAKHVGGLRSDSIETKTQEDVFRGKRKSWVVGT